MLTNAELAELLIHAIEVLVLGMLIPVIRSTNKLITTYLYERENFPPHRHTNGGILFPKGLQPEKENK